MSIQDDRELWVGLIEALPGPQNVEAFGTSSGGFVNVVALCSSGAELAALASARLTEMGLVAGEMDDVELLESRRQRFNIPEALDRLAQSALLSRKIELGEFFLYPNDTQTIGNDHDDEL